MVCRMVFCYTLVISLDLFFQKGHEYCEKGLKLMVLQPIGNHGNEILELSKIIFEEEYLLMS